MAANTGHSNYFSFTNVALSETINELNPGTIYSILVILLVLRGLLILCIFIFRSCCKGVATPKCCKYGNLKYVFFDTTSVKKRTPTFFSALSDRQREAMLREELGTRKRTGIEHLSDETLKKLMQSFRGDEDPEIG